MGLDITAYAKLNKSAVATDDGSDEFLDTHFVTDSRMDWSESVWPGRAEGLDHNAVYSFGDCANFHIGTYSQYGEWRDELANIANGDEFHELIEFADNEGVIGPVVSSKLAKDFISGQSRAESIGGGFLRMYNDWRRAFEMAADGGAVVLR